MTVQTWNHSRKGRITGEIVARAGDFVDIRLAADVEHGRVGFEGDILTVREAFLREVA